MQQISPGIVIALVLATLTNKNVVICSGTPRTLSNGDRRAFLSEHNRWRSAVSPPAGDMLKMVRKLLLFLLILMVRQQQQRMWFDMSNSGRLRLLG